MTAPIPVPSEPRNALLAGLRQLQRCLEEGSLSPGIADVLTDGGSHPGVDVATIDDLCEEINSNRFLYSPAQPVPPRLAPGLEKPTVSAEMYLSGFQARASFNANRALAAADDDQLIELGLWDFSGCEASDRIAEAEAQWNHEIQRLFDLLWLLGDVGVETFGFECKLHEGETMAWIKQHRPAVWARIVCENNGVRFVEAQEPEVAGRWDWIHDQTADASDISFETAGEAALDAVQRLGLDRSAVSA